MIENDKPKFVWASAWGGATSSLSPPLVHSKLRELRRHIGGLEAKKAQYGPSYPVKSAKELETKLQPALDALNLVLTAHYDITPIDVTLIPVTKNRKGESVVVRSACTTKCTVRLIAEDGSFLESQGAGGGQDADDKAVGKASTYSRKDAILKLLAVPEKNMIDTDDEDDLGAVLATPPGQPTPSKPLGTAETDDGGEEAREATYAARIVLCGTKTALKALGKEIQESDLEFDAQLRLNKIYLDKEREL